MAAQPSEILAPPEPPAPLRDASTPQPELPGARKSPGTTPFHVRCRAIRFGDALTKHVFMMAASYVDPYLGSDTGPLSAALTTLQHDTEMGRTAFMDRWQRLLAGGWIRTVGKGSGRKWITLSPLREVSRGGTSQNLEVPRDDREKCRETTLLRTEKCRETTPRSVARRHITGTETGTETTPSPCGVGGSSIGTAHASGATTTGHASRAVPDDGAAGSPRRSTSLHSSQLCERTSTTARRDWPAPAVEPTAGPPAMRCRKKPAQGRRPLRGLHRDEHP